MPDGIAVTVRIDGDRPRVWRDAGSTAVAANPSDDHDLEFERLQRWYTPRRVEAILRRLPHQLERGAIAERSDSRRPKHRPRPDQWIESRLIEQADVIAAYQQLPWDQRVCVFKHLIMGDPLEHVATILGWDPRTVRRCVDRGVRGIAAQLGWVDPGTPEHDESPTVWRNPKLDP